jgi:hypothetical protein
VRHVRMLGLCLVAVFAMSVVNAVPALANEPEPGPFKRFAHCPLHYTGPFAQGEWTGTQACIAAKSSSSSEFHAGNVTVHLTKPITLTGGYAEREESDELQFLGAENGETLKPVAELGPSLGEVVDPSLLSEAERTRFEKDISAGRTKVTATIELAGPPESIFLSEPNILEATGTGLGLPVKVKLSNAFLGKTCYVGSDESPISIELTTGTSGGLTGNVGKLAGINDGSIIRITDDSLVNNTYTTPGVTGCGKEAGAADAAVNAKLGLPSETPESNDAIINGTLWQTSREEAEEYGGL